MPKHIGSSKIIPCSIPDSKLFKNIKGNKYGRLKVLKLAGRVPYKNAYQYYWECICNCGKSVTVYGRSIKTGGTKSCGCLHSEVHSKMLKSMNTTHGKSGTREYVVWKSMLARCRRPLRNKRIPKVR